MQNTIDAHSFRQGWNAALEALYHQVRQVPANEETIEQVRKFLGESKEIAF